MDVDFKILYNLSSVLYKNEKELELRRYIRIKEVYLYQYSYFLLSLLVLVWNVHGLTTSNKWILVLLGSPSDYLTK